MNGCKTEEKEYQLKKMLKKYCGQDIGIAFSGGVDSSLLLAMACEAARETGKKVYAMTMDTVLQPQAELEAAKTVAENTGACHVVLKLDELAIPEIRNNPVDRCYLCKKALYTTMIQAARKKGAEIILEGSNEDDLHVYRPGIKAVRELGVKSPLADCHITKEEVRELAEKYEVPTAKRPSSPCLATRLPYGEKLDLGLLKRIDQAETFLRKQKYQNVRVRVHGNIARIEVDASQLERFIKEREIVVRELKSLGFIYLALDLEGFRSGSMDI